MTAFELTPEHVNEIVMALQDRRVETERYLRSSGFTSCAPGCEHCMPKVRHFEEVQAALEERRKQIVEALTVFGEGPCDCGLRDYEHWKGEHK